MKNIKDSTIVELKAIVYDLLIQSQQVQGQINIVNQEIASRPTEDKKEEYNIQ